MYLKTLNKLEGQVLYVARNTIQIPINKSSNDGNKIYTDYQQYFTPAKISEYLYSSYTRYSLDGETLTDFINNIGLGWNNTVPTNKIIISAKLYIYSTSSLASEIA